MSAINNNVVSRSIKKLILRLKNRNLRSVVSKFAEKSGLVYFGFVNQHTDDHKVVRGLTVSPTHIDNHYCVGSVGGYGITVVDRSDYAGHPNEPAIVFNWLIMSFYLHTENRVPHFFIGANNRDMHPYSALFSTFPNMKEVDLEEPDKYSAEFTSRFTIYARPAKSIEVKQVLPIEQTKVLGAHFWPFSAEQHDNVLYVYSVNERITQSLLETMLENGIWLATQLDLNAEQLQEQLD